MAKFCKHKLFHALAFALLMFVCNVSLAQSIKVSARLDSNTIRVGEQAKIQLSVKCGSDQGGIQIVWPELNDTIIKGIEIVDRSKIDTVLNEKTSSTPSLEQIQTITITSFDSGFYAIPPFRFIVNGDTAHPQFTDAMLFQVHTMPVDTTEAIKDVKPPLEEPFDWHELIPMIKWVALGILLLAGLIVLLTYLLKKKPVVTEKKVPSLPPHVIALAALEKLKEQKLWQEGKLKLYYSELTDILRLYIEHRFKINALEQTSDEIMASFRSIVIDGKSKSRIKQIFMLSDLVKFAKEQPVATENEMSMEQAFAFINGTMRVEEELKLTNNL